MGQVEHGMYTEDDCIGVHPDVIDQYYGTSGTPLRRRRGQTGAGHPPDEEPDEDDNDPDWQDADDDSDSESDEESEHSGGHQDLEHRISAHHQSEFHHEPVGVPKHANPFGTPELQDAFDTAFEALQSSGQVPLGYGVLPEEWDEEGYPSFEILRSGRRGGKELRVALPDFIWRPRAELWVQALAVMNHTLNIVENAG